jgi:hypothetical protein
VEKRPPLFEERIRATNQHTFLDIIKELCNTVIRKRRRRCSANDDDDDDGSDAGSNEDNDDDDDCGIVDHLWELKMYSPDFKPFDPLYDDYDDVDETAGIRIARELQGDELNHDDYRFRTISPRTMLSERALPLGHVGTFQYDFSRTTNIYLKVLSVRTVQGEKEEEAVKNIKDSMFGYFVEAGDQTSNERDIFSMPAYHLPEEEQIDAYYPNFAKACLGKGVPLYQQTSHDDAGGGGGGGGRQRANRKNCWTTGKLTMGLATKISSEQDTTFCALEDSSNSNDLLFCPDVMDLTALFAACEEAWTPKACHPRDDPDALYQYEYGWICRFVLSKDNHEGIERCDKWPRTNGGPSMLSKPPAVPRRFHRTRSLTFAAFSLELQLT